MISVARIAIFFCGACLCTWLAATTEVGAQMKADPERLFRRIDTDGDGKISRDEWNKFSETAPKLKEAKARNFVFERLDENKDGFLTLDEFKKFGQFQKKKNPDARVESKKDALPDKPATAEQIAFFEKKIRPVLVKECYSCHSAEAPKLKAELSLDTRDGIRKGGESGPAIVPGDPKRSLLLKAIKHLDDKLKMPMEKLADEIIADFEKWIATGAADPRAGSVKVAKSEIDIERGRKFWSFQPVKRTAPPQPKDTSWPRGDIDRFLLAGLEAKGLTPVADADPRMLIRRLYFDLIGLPPTPEQADAFVHEYTARPQAAIATVVDHLLASPRFGERWGRHWLDVARFAESSGKQPNLVYPNAWRYRDYVIAAFNADKPFDQFVREQLAGDLLPARDDTQKAEFLVATGFLAIGSKLHNERVALQFQMDLVDEQIDATFLAFQGLTVACARCHDHKFDPIPTRDYYALAGIFRSTETCYGTVRAIQSNHPSALVSLPKGAHTSTMLEPLSADQRAAMEKQLKDLKDQLAQSNRKSGVMMFVRLRVQVANLESRLAQFDADGTPRPLAMSARDKPSSSDSKVFVRGELDQQSEIVKRGVPQVLTTRQPIISKGSGRFELANWIASTENPLTARVMANRIWLHLMGRGIVPTPDNFGASGQAPSNPALVDYLAGSFAENGWSVKKLIRTIVLSRAYQLSPNFDEKNNEIDPDNVLVWRMNQRRLEAEAIRDSLLAISGKLDFTPPRSDPLAKNGEGLFNQVLRGRQIDSFAAEPCRSVYLPIVRDVLPEALRLFDFPDANLIAGERATTTIPAQSLYLMNNPFVIQQSETIADKLISSSGSDTERLVRAYRTFFARPPSPKEEMTAMEFIGRYSQELTTEKKAPNEIRRATWAAFCQSLFASAEFSHR